MNWFNIAGEAVGVVDTAAFAKVGETTGVVESLGDVKLWIECDALPAEILDD